MGINIEAAAHNSIGGRKNNEDSFYLNGSYMPQERMDHGGKKAIHCTNPLQVYAVFDGMGGGEYGEFASYYAASQLERYQKSSEHIDYGLNLSSFLTKTSEDIDRISIKNGLASGACGSTAAILILGEGWYRTAHVGDSRIYLLRDNKLRRITRDQSEVQRLIDMGKITIEEAWSHAKKNVITHHLGMPLHGKSLHSIIGERAILKSGDRFLVCSDGISDNMRDDAICHLLSQNDSAENLAEHIVSNAKRCADDMGIQSDNLTAIVVNVAASGNISAVQNRVKRLHLHSTLSSVGMVLFGLCFAASVAMLILQWI